MEEIAKSTKCPRCHIDIRVGDYFCFNCGYNLKPKPPSTDITAQLTLYIKSFLLPPLGIYWGAAYIKQSDIKSKAVGWIAIIITVVMLIVAFVWTKQFADSLNSQLNDQMTNFGY